MRRLSEESLTTNHLFSINDTARSRFGKMTRLFVKFSLVPNRASSQDTIPTQVSPTHGLAFLFFRAPIPQINCSQLEFLRSSDAQQLECPYEKVALKRLLGTFGAKHQCLR